MEYFSLFVKQCCNIILKCRKNTERKNPESLKTEG